MFIAKHSNAIYYISSAMVKESAERPLPFHGPIVKPMMSCSSEQ